MLNEDEVEIVLHCSSIRCKRYEVEYDSIWFGYSRVSRKDMTYLVMRECGIDTLSSGDAGKSVFVFGVCWNDATCSWVVDTRTTKRKVFSSVLYILSYYLYNFLLSVCTANVISNVLVTSSTLTHPLPTRLNQ